MKLTISNSVIIALIFVICASAKTLTNDPLTGLPLYPATDTRFHLGNEPTKIPDMQICKSKEQADFYAVFDSKVDATAAWYAAHLSGFHKSHAYMDNRSHDTFYNDAGTMVVSVLGERGKDGENVDTHSVTYLRLQPGLPAKTILGFAEHKIVCQ